MSNVYIVSAATLPSQQEATVLDTFCDVEAWAKFNDLIELTAHCTLSIQSPDGEEEIIAWAEDGTEYSNQ